MPVPMPAILHIRSQVYIFKVIHYALKMAELSQYKSLGTQVDLQTFPST